MTSTLLPDLAEGMTSKLRREVERGQAGGLDHRALGDAVVALRVLADLNRHTWDGVRAVLAGGGCEAGLLAERCRFLLKGLDELASLHEALRALAGPVPPERSPGLQEVGPVVAEVLALRPAIADLLAFATRPPAPVDPARLAAADRAFAEGRVVKGRDVIARLRSGNASS
jgi:hypothetical protein